MTELEDFHKVECDWCHREVISFVGPPVMVEVIADIEQGYPTPHHRLAHPRQFWRICLDCYAELIKFITGRWADAIA